jgi:chemotaxis response regulator CheB
MKKKPTSTPKMYVVRTYVMAKNAMDARRRVKKMEPDDIYIDTEWKESGARHLADAIGYHSIPPPDEEDSSYEGGV